MAAEYTAYDYGAQRWLEGEGARLELIRQHRYDLAAHADPVQGPLLRAMLGVLESDHAMVAERLTRELAELEDAAPETCPNGHAAVYVTSGMSMDAAGEHAVAVELRRCRECAYEVLAEVRS